MIVNKDTIEKDLTKGSPLPLSFEWKDRPDGGCALIVTVPVSTPAGIPQVVVAFPPGMPAPFVPRAMARAKQLIDEIFDNNMVGIVFQGAAKAKPSILVPTGIQIPKNLVANG
jgi:hypothetical protein